MNAIQAIGPRLAKFVPLLGSDKPGEIVAAAEAMKRTLSGAGLDFHDLVQAIERGWGATEADPTGNLRPWQVLARDCLMTDVDDGRLSAAETDFLSTMAHWHSEASERQLRWLNAIASRLGLGRRA